MFGPPYLTLTPSFYVFFNHTFLYMTKMVSQVKSGKETICCGTVTSAEIIYVLNPLNLLQCFLLSWLYCIHETDLWIWRQFYIAIQVSFWVEGCFHGCAGQTAFSS